MARFFIGRYLFSSTTHKHYSKLILLICSLLTFKKAGNFVPFTFTLRFCHSRNCTRRFLSSLSKRQTLPLTSLTASHKFMSDPFKVSMPEIVNCSATVSVFAELWVAAAGVAAIACARCSAQAINSVETVSAGSK